MRGSKIINNCLKQFNRTLDELHKGISFNEQDIADHNDTINASTAKINVLQADIAMAKSVIGNLTAFLGGK